jgi:myosin heavy subunit
MEITSQADDQQQKDGAINLDDIVASRSESEKQLADLEAQIKSTRTQLRQQLTAERGALLDRINTVSPRIDRLKEQEVQETKRLEELKKEVVDQTTIQYQNVQKQFDTAQTQLVAVQKQQADVKHSLEEYEKQTDEANKTMAGYQEEEAGMVNRIKQETDISAILKLAEEQKSHVQVLNSKKADLKRQLDVIDVKISNAKDRLTTLPKDEDGIKQKQAVLAEQIKNLQAQIKAKQEARERERTNSAAKLTQIKQDLTDNQSRYATLSDQLKTAKAKLKDYFDVTQSVAPVAFKADQRYVTMYPDLTPQYLQQHATELKAVKAAFEQQKLIPTVVTTDYDDYLSMTWQRAKKDGLVVEGARLLNLYQSLQETEKPGVVKEDFIPKNDDWEYSKDEATHSETVRDQDKQPVMQVKWRPNETLWYILYFSQGNVIKRDVFDLKGRLSATQYLDPTNAKKVVSENFYRTNGSLVLVKEYNDDNKETIQLLNESGVLLEVFSAENELLAWWLRNMVIGNEPLTILTPISAPYFTYLSQNHADQVQLMALLADGDEEEAAFRDILTGRTALVGVLAATKKQEHELTTQSQVSLQVSQYETLLAQ